MQFKISSLKYIEEMKAKLIEYINTYELILSKKAEADALDFQEYYHGGNIIDISFLKKIA